MHLKKYASNKLYIAVLTTTLSSIQTIAYAEQTWNCRQTAVLWDCGSASAATLSLEEDTDQLALLSSLPAELAEDAPNTDTQSNNKITEIKDNAVALDSPTVELNRERTKNNKPKTTQQRNSGAIESKAPRSLQSVVPKTPQKAPIIDDKSSNKPLDETPINGQQIANDYKHLDWYPYTSSNQPRGVCKGRYISPQIAVNSSEDAVPDINTVFVSADQSATEIGKESTLKGNVDIRQGNKTLHSTLATLNQETGAYSLESGVTFRQTGMMISAARAQGNMNEEEVRLYDTKYVVHDKNIRGDAAVLIRRTKEVLDIEEGSYTFCPPGNESWKISASNINLDIAAGFGRADDARLKLFNNTVLYLPVFYFPIDDRRKSGFLYPSFKFSSNESSITLPYYFNIAPQMDDTLTTTLFSDSNILLENELRYLDKNSRNRFSNAMASKEDSNSGKRWLLGLNHEGKYDKITTNINYVRVSDDDYFSDFGSNLNTDEGENDHLDQSAKVTYQADTWQSSVLVQQYQTIDNTKTTPYRRLPEIRFSGSPDDNFDNFDISYRSVLTRFDRDLDGLSAAERTTGDRLIINPSITGEFRSIWGYARPAAKLWHASYNLNNQADNINSKQNVTVPILEVDSGLLFDRDFSFQDTDYIQTLEPRLYGLYVPYRDQTSLPDFDTSELTFTYDSLFRDNRFSGDDRFGDAKQISLGLTSRVISEQGREIISASVGHAFYFDDRKVRIDPNDSSLEENTSDFATALTWRPNKRVRALFDASFGASTFKNSEMTIDLKYEEDPDHVIGLRHRFTRGTRKQTTLSYLWPINPNWSSLGLVQYNWLSSQTVDLAAGLEYQTCCWKTRIVIRDELESNNKKETSIALQFVLTGLGGIGKSPTKELQDKIKGYQKREYYNANN